MNSYKMRKKILVFLFIILFSNTCYSAKLPTWITNVGNECDKNSICATGSGKNLESAKADARSNAQKVFETRVESNFRNEITNRNDITNEYSSDLVNEESSGILKGVEITKTFENEGTFYVLATLDKSKTAKEIEFEIKKLDSKMKILLEDKTFSSNKKLENIYFEREKLNNKHLFLTGKNIVEVVKYDKIFKNKKELEKTSAIYFIDIKEEDGSINSLIKNLLSENGIKISNNKQGAKRIIKGSITSKKEFLNVDGFEKYSIILNLETIENGIDINTLNKKITETGMNYEQIYSKVISQFSSFITENFINLIE